MHTGFCLRYGYGYYDLSQQDKYGGVNKSVKEGEGAGMIRWLQWGVSLQLYGYGCWW
jgi:hypothetical protein